MWNSADPIRDFLEHWKPVADWLVGLGTVGTVVVSLWLARRDSRTRLQVSAETYLALFRPQEPHAQHQVTITIVNEGLRPVAIDSFGYQVWPHSRPRILPLVGAAEGDPRSTALTHGQQTRFSQPLEPWLDGAIEAGLADSWWKILRLRVVVRTTLGHIETRRVGTRLRDALHRRLGQLSIPPRRK
jgi:hypothetical protein